MTSSAGATAASETWALFFREFELMVLNGSWVDALNCQRTAETCCDLTSDLGSDSDYSLRVRARCGPGTSAWARASSPFNRRDSENRHLQRFEAKRVSNMAAVCPLGSGRHGATAERDVGGGGPSGVHQ